MLEKWLTLFAEEMECAFRELWRRRQWLSIVLQKTCNVVLFTMYSNMMPDEVPNTYKYLLACLDSVGQGWPNHTVFRFRKNHWNRNSYQPKHKTWQSCLVLPPPPPLQCCKAFCVASCALTDVVLFYLTDKTPFPHWNAGQQLLEQTTPFVPGVVQTTPGTNKLSLGEGLLLKWFFLNLVTVWRQVRIRRTFIQCSSDGVGSYVESATVNDAALPIWKSNHLRCYLESLQKPKLPEIGWQTKTKADAGWGDFSNEEMPRRNFFTSDSSGCS